MPIIDKQGFIHILWFKINIIDFLAIVFLLCMLPVFYFGYKLHTQPIPLPPIETTYKIARSCPNCGKSVIIDTIEGEEIGIPKGELLPEVWKVTCPRCVNEVFLIKPKPILSAINWSQALDEYLLREADFEYYKRMLEKGLP